MVLIFTNMPLNFRICNPRQSATPSILLDDVVIMELILHHMCSSFFIICVVIMWSSSVLVKIESILD